MTPPFSDLREARRTIREKVLGLAARRGVDARILKDDEVIVASGVLDSTALLELILWIEMTYDLVIEQSDLTAENFGTVDAMAAYLLRAC
jgi:acyl carrier protein